MLIERFIANYARKKNESYLQFAPSASITIPRSSGDMPTLLYMHVPFCEELCPYCSFNRVTFQEGLARSYFAALRKEIIMYKELGYDFKALYVGGGTPTVLIDELEETINLTRQKFNIIEVSVETNPNHLTPNNIEMLKKMGVNRLSVGVQTFDDGLLETIERYHKYGSGQEIAERLQYTQGNFQTLNVDMIFNFPTQTMEILEKDLSTLIGLKVDQVTYYPLMVSSFTRDIMNSKLGSVDYDRGKDFYQKITEMFSAQYKASTAWCFSRNNKIADSRNPARGNLAGVQAPVGEILSTQGVREGEAPAAWLPEGATPLRGQAQAPVIDEYVVNYEEYAGLGSGSIGYLGGSAYANTFDIRAYIERINEGLLPVAAKKAFSMKERLCYDLLMKLFGLSLDIEQLSAKHGVNIYRYLWPEIVFFRLTGGMEKHGNLLTLTKKGQYYWVLMMREFFVGVNNFRDYCRAQLGAEDRSQMTEG
ncbi:MAG: radical SAM protein [Proteobacteria bacterium]|nr:radical SAM protein [Pseudomonadota bacterium]